jgi:hypothetical protein
LTSGRLSWSPAGIDDYDASTYGDRIADTYDEWYAGGGPFDDVSGAVSFLAELAGPGPALELGVGTGRIALPLLLAGVEVHGIDASEAMLARLRAKDGGDRVSVTVGDFRDFDLGIRFPLVYVVFNTFFALLTQDDQVTCFQTVARHLANDGAFAMEAFVPDVARFDRGQRVGAIEVSGDGVRLDVSQHDGIAQRTETQHLVIREDGVRLYPVKLRYAYVAELDLMARLAGMRLRERWADWDRSPLSASSARHVSVWERAPTAPGAA